MNFVVLALLMLTIQQIDGAVIKCEIIWNTRYYHTNRDHLKVDLKTCFMYYSTAIDSPGIVISTRDSDVGGLDFAVNKKVRFLPERVAESFPNLVGYTAWSCSLTEIYKTNFKNLINLRKLDLGENQIEKISSNTFEDLRSLEKLDLSKKFYKGAFSYY